MSVVASPPWTAEEDEKLRALANGRESAVGIAIELNRSVCAIRRRANVLKILLGVASIRAAIGLKARVPK